MERSQDDNTTQKGDMRDIRNYRTISLLSHTCKLFTRILQKRMEKVLDENQQREQAGFRKVHPTVDHLQTINQLIEKYKEFCIGYIDYEKAFDFIEHEAIYNALRSIVIIETYITILEDTYTGATAKVYMDNQLSLRRNTNIKRHEAGRPNFPQIIHSNNSGGV